MAKPSHTRCSRQIYAFPEEAPNLAAQWNVVGELVDDNLGSQFVSTERRFQCEGGAGRCDHAFCGVLSTRALSSNDTGLSEVARHIVQAYGLVFTDRFECASARGAAPFKVDGAGHCDRGQVLWKLVTAMTLGLGPRTWRPLRLLDLRCWPDSRLLRWVRDALMVRARGLLLEALVSRFNRCTARWTAASVLSCLSDQ